MRAYRADDQSESRLATCLIGNHTWVEADVEVFHHVVIFYDQEISLQQLFRLILQNNFEVLSLEAFDEEVQNPFTLAA